MNPSVMRAALAAVLVVALTPVCRAQEAVIRATLAKNLPDLPAIDEVRTTPVTGLFEVRMGTDILYTDAHGEHVIEGKLTETRTRVNLTDARIEKLTAIDFATLPLQDAIVWKQGSGARKLVVFADPNCGYCKKFETELQQVKDITVYTFLYPVLGGDSPQKSRDLWCAKNNAVAWRDWMIRGSAAPQGARECDTGALQRNLALGKRYRVNGTPALVFEDGKRVPGALPPAAVEKQLATSGAKAG